MRGVQVCSRYMEKGEVGWCAAGIMNESVGVSSGGLLPQHTGACSSIQLLLTPHFGSSTLQLITNTIVDTLNTNTPSLPKIKITAIAHESTNS